MSSRVSSRRSAESSRGRPVLGGAILAVVGSMFVIGELNRTDGDGEVGIVLSIILVTLIAALLVAKRPGHVVSWLMAGAAVFGGIAGLSASVWAPGTTELSALQAVIAAVSGPSWFGLLLFIFVLIPLYFPTGAPPSRRWTWVALAPSVGWVVMSVLWAFQERFCTDWDGSRCLSSVDNPFGIPGVENPEQSLLGSAAFAALAVGAVAALISLVVRFRRADVTERLQIKWVLLGLGVFVGGTVILELVWMGLLGQPEPTGPIYYWINQISWLVIPGTVALAILRYRLYDLDRIISRGVSYVLLLALLAVVALALVALMTLALPSRDPLVVAVATLASAALFNPLRVRTRIWVDRRFNRTRFNATHVAEQFAGSLRNRVDPDDVVNDWLDVVSETMQPASVGVWVRS